MRASLPDAGPALGDYVGEAWQCDAINPQEILKRSEGLKSPQPDDFLSPDFPYMDDCFKLPSARRVDVELPELPIYRGGVWFS